MEPEFDLIVHHPDNAVRITIVYLLWLFINVCEIMDSNLSIELVIVSLLYTFLFNVRPSDLCSLLKVRHVIGCTNHDIVVGLCSELFMRFSY